MVVRVREYDRFLSCFTFGTISAECLMMGPFFIRCYPLFSAENGCREGKTYICWVTSVNFICYVPLSRRMNASEVKRRRAQKSGVTVLLCGLKCFTCSGSCRC